MKKALPFYKDGKRIMFPQSENFGPGSYRGKFSMHVFPLSGESIIPMRYTTTIKERDGKERKSTTDYNGIIINIWEN